MSEATALRLGIDLLSRRPLREETYDALRTAILSGRFKPGERLVQRDVAEQLGLSRSPVREALMRLEQEGLVQDTRQGLVVRGLEPGEVEELYRIRGLLESYSARMAARNCTPEDVAAMRALLAREADGIEAQDPESVMEASRRFHNLIAQVAGGRRLAQFILSIQEDIDRFRRVSHSLTPRGAVPMQEHERIVDALEAHDEELAARLMENHVSVALQYVTSVLAGYRGAPPADRSEIARRAA